MVRCRLLNVLTGLSLAAFAGVGWAWATSFGVEVYAVHTARQRTVGVAARGGRFAVLELDVRGYVNTPPDGWTAAADGGYSVLATPPAAVVRRATVDGRLALAACLVLPAWRAAAGTAAARRRGRGGTAFEVVPPRGPPPG